ncbi:hypothetical protein HK097_002499 [Rhizophlyctis rosea]|uniref:Uncharacterized protein n=1 Tax=Rhizophlyctis rosea TaxID=64517 RepID=A0AAD5X445_9FUNG|nr:hypothetical protein HK097_002499 [Rhizophlyctis rosea]
MVAFDLDALGGECQDPKPWPNTVILTTAHNEGTPPEPRSPTPESLPDAAPPRPAFPIPEILERILLNLHPRIPLARRAKSLAHMAVHT